MSLLMDALRKAEQQKQQKSSASQQNTEEGTWSAMGLSLEPVVRAGTDENAVREPELPARPEQSRLPELPARLEDLDEQFMAHAAQSHAPSYTAPAAAVPPPADAPPAMSAASAAHQAPPSAEPERETEATPELARKIFEVKQPAAKNPRKLAIAVGLLGLVAAAGIGAYVWWEIQPKSSLGIVSTPARVPAPIAAPTVPPAPPAPQPTPAPPVAAVPPAPTSGPATQPPGAPEPVAESAPEPKPKIAPRRERPSAAPESESPIRLATSVQKLDPTLDQAYQAFNRGEHAQAQALWQKLLAREPRNPDALHGLATLALHQNKVDLAADYLLRALESDPRDARALSGLYALKPPTDAVQAESRLKLLLAEQPDSPHLNLALGNLYAREQRWADAQQAYFRAHTADPTNPDYLFNLAVSLDQLRQKRLAAQYYGKAIDAAERQPAAFDAAQASVRLKDLQSALQQ